MAAAAMARMIAGMLGIDLVHLLTGGTGFLVGRVIHFDFFDLSVESNSVLKLPRCFVCGPQKKTVDHNRHVGLDAVLADFQ